MYGRKVVTENIGNRSGNALLERLNQERVSMKEEAYEIMREERRQKHFKMCPVCDTVGYVPDNDYMCESCREGL